MEVAKIREIVLEAMANINLTRAPGERLEVSETAAIFGPGSPLDSLGLVALLMDIEDAMAGEGCPITLSDERAMSQTRSPFRNVGRLVQYISTIAQSPQ
jgi:acyl carrier protein